MFSELKEKFEDYGVGTVGTIILVLITFALYLGIIFGFYTLVIYVFSLAFGFAFKWIYVLALWLGVEVLKRVFNSNKDVD
jgi:hypothetical protein